MKFKKIKVGNPDFKNLYSMIEEMKNYLQGEKTAFSLDGLLALQNENGSFSLFESYNLPREAIVDFIYLPSYIGTSILMKEYLSGNGKLKERLEKALIFVVNTKLKGHGYESENFLVESLKILINGGLLEFLEKERGLVPKFHKMIHNIIHRINAKLYFNKTKDLWGSDYSKDLLYITETIKLKKRLYLAYGSNMNKDQMLKRCHEARYVGKTYLKDWQLTMPFYANIEVKEGVNTPVAIWEISNNDEAQLDKYEGYSRLYDKKEMIVNIDSKDMSTMAYVMTDNYKKEKRVVSKDYIKTIIKGYQDSGFSTKEFKYRDTSLI